jgi:subtilisin family serine protease
LGAVVASAAASVGGATAATAESATSSLYLVQVVGAPLASYDGSIADLAATKPAAGEQLDATSAAAVKYRDHLKKNHGDVLRDAGISASRQAADYGVTFNGFAAHLTASEADQLAHTPGVVKVWPDEIITVDTITTPHFLGLDGPTGVWQQEFGGADRAGEGVIVGVLDSGIWPENPSFGPLPDPRRDAAAINKKWHGECVTGVEEPISCNNKLLGARYYHDSVIPRDAEFLSPRDFNGHGSHTASTSAGNNNVAATINGGSVGNISGMAPQARLAAYKVLWDTGVNGQASGGTADIVAAIDDAVADGVDVINYSISGSRTLVVDPVEIAFFNAAAAGVFVSTSAGNNGDDIGVSSVAHNSPWLMTVGASSHDRGSNKTVTLGNGASYAGVGVGPGVGPAPLIPSTGNGLPGADPTQVTLCFIGTLDPAKVTGKIVVCDRGVNNRVDKSLAVANAGGVGMILANTVAGQSLNADFHSVPSIHVDNVAGTAIKAYLTGAGAGATATISAQDPTPVRAPEMASFSSFGPALAGGGDLLKPDITAPGVDVIAAVAPPGNLGNNFNSLSGTSMSSPHIAGLAALIKSAHPTWSPMWIKSALMTNATTLDNTGQPIRRSGVNATPLNFGSGHVVPAPSFDPGLVYDSTPVDWIRYGCAIGQIQLITDPSFCPSFGSADPSDLNYPSIAVGDLTGSQTITRSVTNIDNGVGWYDATVQAPPGFTATISPARLKVLQHQSATYTVTITRTTAPLGQYAFGSVTLSDGTGGHRGHVVRSPIAVRPVALAAPIEFVATGGTGASLSLKIGYNGTLNSSVVGLVGATVGSTLLDVTGPAFSSGAPAASSRTSVMSAAIPAGTSFARFATFDADFPAGTDVDLFLYRVNANNTRTLVGSSGGGTAEEVITLNAPVAATYELYANLFALSGGATTTTVRTNHWVVGNTVANGFAATPASQAVTIGTNATVNLSWSGLTAGVRYLGRVTFTDASAIVLGRTTVMVTG